MESTQKVQSSQIDRFLAISAGVVCVALMFGFSASPAHASQVLAKSKACLACHAVDKKVVGPAFKDVKTKYASDTSTQAYLEGKIKNGSKGVWGEMPMPKQNVSDEEAKALAAWIIGL